MICYYIQFNKHEKLNQEHIIKLDGLPYLIDLANNIHTEACGYADICNLYRYNRTFIVDSGGLKPLILMTSSDRLEIFYTNDNQIAIVNS